MKKNLPDVNSVYLHNKYLLLMQMREHDISVGGCHAVNQSITTSEKAKSTNSFRETTPKTILIFNIWCLNNMRFNLHMLQIVFCVIFLKSAISSVWGCHYFHIFCLFTAQEVLLLANNS